MATTEIFNYTNVKSALSSVDDAKNSAKQSLDNGTRAIEGSIGTAGGAGTALSGTSANLIKSKWDELTNNFVEFTRYIDSTIEKANQAGAANQSLESDLISSVG